MPAKKLVTEAVDRGVTSLALTNINSTCDIWDFVEACRTENIKPIVGAEIRNEDELLYILLAANNAGLNWIHSFISDHLETKSEFPKPANENTFFAMLLRV